jgi:beta-galactosidase
MKPLFLLLALTLTTAALADDSIFPPAPAARGTINFDGTGFIINGHRTFVTSGSIHYARVPHELWEDRLQRLKAGSFNTVESYAFWNFQEPRENEFDFTGDRDFGAFLATAQKLGLYALTRVGPYVCAEWDFGGYPIWIKFKPSFNLRTDDPGFLALNDHWYGKILPIVARHQINHGGNVIMVQLENEHPAGWGMARSPYFDHLGEVAMKQGIEVPYFFSGLNHGGTPRVADPDTSKRTSPWFTTEFWAGWFDAYGADSGRARNVDLAQWAIIARGGAGYNFYMLHGGSNFETWNDPSGAGSYDYGAAIGQTGDLRPMYYKMKRANQFAQSFPEILANGSEASNDAEYKDFVTGATLTGVRKSPAGTIAFITADKSGTATLKGGSTLELSPNETFPIVRDAILAKGLKLADTTLRVLAVAHNEQTATIVVHGHPGDAGSLVLDSAAPVAVQKTSPAFSPDIANPARVRVKVRFPDPGPEECLLKAGNQFIRIVAVSSDLGLYTWITGQPGSQFVVCGPHYITDLKVAGGKASATIERPYGTPSCGQVAIYGSAAQSFHLGVKADPSLDAQPAPALSAWQMAVSPETSPQFDDSKWKTSTAPLEMGTDGDTSAFAWYRATVESPTAGSGTLQFTGRDRLLVFVNGQAATVRHKADTDQWEATATFVAGKNSVAVFASHAGRDKVFGRTQPVVNFDNKGIYGPVTLQTGAQTINVTGWRMRGGAGSFAKNSAWRSVADTQGRPAHFRATFHAKPPGRFGAHPILRVDFTTLTRGTMWINGHCLGRYPEKIPVHSLYIPECWLKDGENELVVFDENGGNPNQVRILVEAEASREVIPVSEPVDSATPMTVPTDAAGKSLAYLNRGNLAYQRPVTASSSQNEKPAEAVTDGDIETSWCSGSEAPGAWIQTDLGASKGIKTVEIVWEQPAKYYEYTLEGSQDGTTWTPLGNQTTAVPTSPDSPSEISRLILPTVRQAHYVRLKVTGGLTEKRWPCIKELRVLGQ